MTLELVSPALAPEHVGNCWKGWIESRRISNHVWVRNVVPHTIQYDTAVRPDHLEAAVFIDRNVAGERSTKKPSLYRIRRLLAFRRQTRQHP